MIRRRKKTKYFKKIYLTANVRKSLWKEIWNFAETPKDDLKYNIKKHKELVIFRDKYTKVIIGIVAVDIYNFYAGRSKKMIIFTSNTILNKRYRGKNIIQKIGLFFFIRTKLKNPFSSIYWFFRTYSYKSYLLLARNFFEYCPRYDKTTPDIVKKMINQLCIQRYGVSYLSKEFKLKARRKKLKPFVAPIKKKDLSDPNIYFFQSANPYYYKGDRLACLCPLSMKNIFILLCKTIGKYFSERLHINGIFSLIDKK